MRVKDIKIMGVLNVTPDSFSDGGKFDTLENALKQAEKLVIEGADIIDVGGESTRPFSQPVSLEEELNRVLPVIQAIRERFSVDISIDTSKAEVARAAFTAGADILNDVTALQKDPEMIEVVRDNDVPVILMHMQGTPSDMQIRPRYDNVIEEIVEFFRDRIEKITAAGVDKKRIMIDPGIGFGKSQAHNLSILKNLNKLTQLEVPVMLAHSRKSFMGKITGVSAEKERDLATAIVTALCACQGISIVRVHDVAATRQALRLARALQEAA